MGARISAVAIKINEQQSVGAPLVGARISAVAIKINEQRSVGALLVGARISAAVCIDIALLRLYL